MSGLAMIRLRASIVLLLMAALLCLPCTVVARASGDPLPSWNEGHVKRSLVSFVQRVSDPASADYMLPSERVAVFDNDGTLWPEQPVYFQLQFAMDRAAELASADPSLASSEPYRGLLSGDPKAVASIGERGVAELMMRTHAGMKTDEFEGSVRAWMDIARHPRFGRRYTELAYVPMIELLSYLRDNDFTVFIVSGGGVDFMRPWAPKVYGVPESRIIGSSVKAEFLLEEDVPVIRKLAELEFVDDGPGKPVGIHRFIGKRPVLAVGNSDGDLQMLQWTTINEGLRLGVIVHHTDADREWAYDRDSPVGKLDKALDESGARGWLVVDMARDWSVIFAGDR